MVLAIVVTYNRLNMLKGCLEHLFNQTNNEFEVLVINNNSSDGTAEYLQSIRNDKLRYISTKDNIGGAGGFNLGMRYAAEHEYDYAWLMDDDVFVENDALENLLLASKTVGNFGFLASRVNDVTGERCKLNLPKYVRSNSSTTKYNRIKTSTFVSFFVPVSVIKDVGLPIKEFFIWNDDIEYSLRISDKYNCYQVDESVVVHMINPQRGGSIATDGEERIERYFLAYRNDHCLYRRRGLKGILFYYAKCGYNFLRILLFAPNHRAKRIKTLTKGFWAGFHFNPPIEMV